MVFRQMQSGALLESVLQVSQASQGLQLKKLSHLFRDRRSCPIRLATETRLAEIL